MSVPPILVSAARKSWNWQWNQLMNGLAPCDKEGNYCRPTSQKLNAIPPSKEEILNRPKNLLPRIIIGRSCPWAHRTWLLSKLRNLESSLELIIAKVNYEKGLWEIEPPWLGCKTLIDLYKACGTPPSHRATVPALIDPGKIANEQPRLLGNESSQLIEVLNEWPSNQNSLNLAPLPLQGEINKWQSLLQLSVNDGVYRCGFARNQSSYNKASEELFEALEYVEKSLSLKGPWLCGEELTLADIRLFPTLIRWETVYEPLFNCSQKPLWLFPNIFEWRKKFFEMPKVKDTCNSMTWRQDYFGALFPLRPNNIVPLGPDLTKIVRGII